MEIRVPSVRWPWLAAIAALTAAGCDSTSSSSGPVPPSQPVPEIKTLSNRADMISGGDALVEIVLPPGATAGTLHVTVGPPGKPAMAQDVSDRFTARAGRLIGLVTGLAEGPNVLSADLGTGHGVFLKITNHNIGGPIFSGPHVTPFVCATATGAPGADGLPAKPSGLSGTASTDGLCNIPTEARLFYRTSGTCNPLVNPDPVPFPATLPVGACFKPYDPASPPADLAMTTTDAGVMVPFIVRIERGTLNRGIFDIAVLFDPTKDDVKTGWKPVAPQAAWNGKVLYTFGASSGHPRVQLHSEQSWADATISTNAAALGKGFLVAMNSMTDSLFNDNRVMMTETLMMMKEKIIDSYGEVRYVMGNGCSGGSINQVTAASIFPGLLDGIQPTCTYPDSETTAIEVSDCALLVNFYNSAAWTAQLTTDGIDINDPTKFNPVKAAINGHLDQSGCHAWVNSFANLGHPGLYVPTVVTDNNTGKTGPGGAQANNCSLPNSLVYDPVSNPKGLRCTAQDNAAAIFGTVDGAVKDTKRAQTTVDNVGIQYGLKAFLAGKISPEMFVILNENIGGIDADDNFTSASAGAQAPFARSVADAGALATAYRAGIVGDAVHWAQTPIIDLRGWDDRAIHHVWRSFALRARLDAANGNHANYVMWRYPAVLAAVQSGDPATFALTMQSFTMMDQWLTAMKTDTKSTTQVARIAAARPPGAFDFCNKPIDATHSSQVTDFALCDSDPALVPHASPRQIAGGPVAENVLKCQLRPLNRADYNPIGLSDAQFNRLKAVFPDGVCDFSKPGVGQQAAIGPLDFSAGPGGVPFAAPPQQQPF
jgi:hypothetical protein